MHKVLLVIKLTEVLVTSKRYCKILKASHSVMNYFLSNKTHLKKVPVQMKAKTVSIFFSVERCRTSRMDERWLPGVWVSMKHSLAATVQFGLCFQCCLQIKLQIRDHFFLVSMYFDHLGNRWQVFLWTHLCKKNLHVELYGFFYVIILCLTPC